eukprot:11185048-Lingulodinium_polyedra.AAC.1
MLAPDAGASAADAGGFVADATYAMRQRKQARQGWRQARLTPVAALRQRLRQPSLRAIGEVGQSEPKHPEEDQMQ